jgi:hypothetical protein
MRARLGARHRAGSAHPSSEQSAKGEHGAGEEGAAIAVGVARGRGSCGEHGGVDGDPDGAAEQVFATQRSAADDALFRLRYQCAPPTHVYGLSTSDAPALGVSSSSGRHARDARQRACIDLLVMGSTDS